MSLNQSMIPIPEGESGAHKKNLIHIFCVNEGQGFFQV